MTSQRDWLRLEPKGKQSGSGSLYWPEANTRTAGVQSGPKSSIVMTVEHGKAANPAPARSRADLTARRVRGNSLGRTEKAKASGNTLDMPTSVWSETARKRVEPPSPGKANDDQRQLVDASWGCGSKERSFNGHKPVLLSDSASFRPIAGRPNRVRLYEGSSRMKGNFHVRF